MTCQGIASVDIAGGLFNSFTNLLEMGEDVLQEVSLMGERSLLDLVELN